MESTAMKSTESSSSLFRSAGMKIKLTDVTRLSLDNPALARSGETAETYLAGVTHRIRSRWNVTADAGFRQLPDGDQNLYRGELSWNHELARITLGSQLGDHDLGYNDTLNYVGVGIPIGSRWRVESTYYSSETVAASAGSRRSRALAKTMSRLLTQSPSCRYSAITGST